MSSGDLSALININVIILFLKCSHCVFHMACLRQKKKRAKELKTRETIQLTAVPPGRFAGAPYHDDAPRDFELIIQFLMYGLM